MINQTTDQNTIQFTICYCSACLQGKPISDFTKRGSGAKICRTCLTELRNKAKRRLKRITNKITKFHPIREYGQVMLKAGACRTVAASQQNARKRKIAWAQYYFFFEKAEKLADALELKMWPEVPLSKKDTDGDLLPYDDSSAYVPSI